MTGPHIVNMSPSVWLVSSKDSVVSGALCWSLADKMDIHR